MSSEKLQIRQVKSNPVFQMAWEKAHEVCRDWGAVGPTIRERDEAYVRPGILTVTQAVVPMDIR